MIAPPKLSNDCFALPPGVEWEPLDVALARLRDRMHPVVPVETIPIWQANGRVLAADMRAERANPPGRNTAVDGYGFAGPLSEGPHLLPLAQGRAAAGVPYVGILPAGQALRVLTGAVLPEGVDTVVLQEDVNVNDTHVALNGPLKQGANTRAAGEDFEAGDSVATKGTRLRPQDLALLAAAGFGTLPVFAKLRVGVLSNGDEVIAPGTVPPSEMGAGAIYDSNRPMVLPLLADWGFDPVDLGHVPDSRDALRDRLAKAASSVDAILTSGGVSTGDEDHVSALLQSEGQMETWRIALKPGRPLALGLWDGVPVFGLPGNPVAAGVCAMIFGRPALGALAGQAWHSPQGFVLPAGFRKRKKPGRREYLRARVSGDGRVEVFASEGSGRISSLAWAQGLVELPDAGGEIAPGDPVRYIPFESFR